MVFPVFVTRSASRGISAIQLVSPFLMTLAVSSRKMRDSETPANPPGPLLGRAGISHFAGLARPYKHNAVTHAGRPFPLLHKSLFFFNVGYNFSKLDFFFFFFLCAFMNCTTRTKGMRTQLHHSHESWDPVRSRHIEVLSYPYLCLRPSLFVQCT